MSPLCRIIVCLCTAATLVACSRERPVHERFADAVPRYHQGSCVEPNEKEKKAFELAAAAIELNLGGRIPDSMEIGAKQLLGQRLYRNDEESKVSELVCTPPAVLTRVEAAFTARKGFGAGRLVEYELMLAEQLPSHSKEIVQAVGASAFNDSIQQSEIFRYRDIRPYARTVLAEFGVDAQEYGAKAYEQIDMATPMGTGAAQVAAAAHHANALPRIRQLMEGALAAVPLGKAIPWETKNRLYELAWAIVFAGEEGRGYTAPIHEIMKRKVQSFATIFGMVELNPKRFCAVLRRIEGESSITAYAYCLDDSIPIDQ